MTTDAYDRHVDAVGQPQGAGEDPQAIMGQHPSVLMSQIPFDDYIALRDSAISLEAVIEHYLMPSLKRGGKDGMVNLVQERLDAFRKALDATRYSPL